MRITLLCTFLLAMISSASAQRLGQSGGLNGGTGLGGGPDGGANEESQEGGLDDLLGAGGEAAAGGDEGLEDLFGDGGSDAASGKDVRRLRPRRRGHLPAKVPNPFDIPKPRHGEMMGMMGMDDMEDMGMMEGISEDEYGGDMEMGMGGMGGLGTGGMGMGMGMGGMGEGETSKQRQDRAFREGLQRAITALKKTNSEGQKEVLLGYVREAFENRYDRIVIERKQELERIKVRLEQLENDLKRRVAAKQRVVNIQIQSVQLASEGLLELNGQ